MRQVQAHHVPAYIGRSRRPGEFWWITRDSRSYGMSAACPCGCGAEFQIYHGVSGTPTYPSVSGVVGCSRGSQWTLRNGLWEAAGHAIKVPEPMF